MSIDKKRSREILVEVRTIIVELRKLAKDGKRARLHRDKLLREKKNPDPMEYTDLPTNNYEITKKQYDEEWEKTKSIKKLFSKEPVYTESQQEMLRVMRERDIANAKRNAVERPKAEKRYEMYKRVRAAEIDDEAAKEERIMYECAAKVDKLFNKLEKYDVLEERFRDEKLIDIMIGYLDAGRASDIFEAMALCEKEYEW